jgi:DNA-binding NtrC family response regulator
MTRILVVDDDPVQLKLTAEVARHAGFTPVTAGGGDAALRLLRADPGFGAVILDLVMPDRDGMAVMEAMARDGITTPVIVQTAHGALETVVTAMRQGAVDFFVKPVAPERLVVSLRNALQLGALEAVVRSERHRRAGTLGLDDIVTGSPAMHRVLTLVRKAARSPIPVLVEGEAGTGKALVARVIHGLGDRAARPFVAVDCAALPAPHIDATLFEPGRGKVAEAQGGTLYLDAIGELPADAQARLLRLLDKGEIAPLGGGRPERANVRLIAATSRRLLELTRAGGFREDLFYRLNVLPIYVPPLRERRDDVTRLAHHFIARFAAETGRRVAGLAPEATALLEAYDWPGNVRQLENALYRAVLLAEGGDLAAADFPQIVAHQRGRAEMARLTAALPTPSAPVHIDAARPRPDDTATPDRFLDASGEVAPLPELERELIAFALRHYGGRMSKVARALRIGRSTLYRKLRDYGLEEGAQSDAA